MFNYFRFRYRRQIRQAQRRLSRMKRSYTAYTDKHLRGKWLQLRLIRRFILVWLAIIVIGTLGVISQIRDLNQRAHIAVAAPGGVVREAAIGSVKSLNPILPENSISADINRLVFSSLTQHNSKREIVGDLATSWDISADGKTYTFHLRPNILWHDGVEFGPEDVVFTLAAIQNPDSRSPLTASWQGVKAEAKGKDTVIFTLPNPLSSFLDSTSVGILPRHILESVDPTALRENSFNQRPIGTGPFKIKSFAPAANEISLVANENYYAGRPKLDGYRFDLFESNKDAVNAYASRSVDAIGRIAPEFQESVEKLKALKIYNYKLPSEVTLFFKTDGTILEDKTLRRILSASVSRKKIVEAANNGVGLSISQPILPGQPGYTTAFAISEQSQAESTAALKKAGWMLRNGVQTKDGKSLRLNIVTLKGGELERAANELKSQWNKIGVELSVTAVIRSDLEQSYIRTRKYQMLLYGINLGADPDVYAFWHSSQIKDPGLNLSSYNSPEADKALEAGRIKTDIQIRKGKYLAFLKAWNSDAPAIVLYQLTYQYGINNSAAGLADGSLVEPNDRFYNVQNWTIQTDRERRFDLRK